MLKNPLLYSNMRMLQNSREIAAALQDLFSSPDRRRVALVAFVGADAETYLPAPNGIELICWDKEGGTDAEVLRRLKRQEVGVHFVDKLHTKLFWCRGKGAILGSANLTANGLGEEGLHEMAVLLPPEALSEKKLDALIGSLETRPATSELLDDLARRNRQFRSRNGGDDFLGQPHSPPRMAPLFSEWLAARRTESKTCGWRITVSEENFNDAEEDDLETEGYLLHHERNRAEYWSGSKGQTEKNHWILFTDLTEQPSDISWVCADRQTRVKREDKPLCGGYPYFAIQMTKNPGLQPFRLDKSFKAALRKFLRKIGADSQSGSERMFPDGTVTFRQLLELEKIVRLQHKTP